MIQNFQVDLRGVIELLSGHLYSGPAVFVRELLQNAVDAIGARQILEPRHAGSIRFELITAAECPATLLVQDDGIGLTEAEVHQFLATIGQSSKRGDFIGRPDDFLGQFGIGLLSCFMVTDEIVVITRSSRGDAPAVEWRGKADGTYEVRVLETPMSIGTQVYLQAKSEAAELFEPESLLRLLRNYGEFLELPITFIADGGTHRINRTPPWREDFRNEAVREQLLGYASDVFNRDCLDIVPLQSAAGGVEGLAFVLAEPVSAISKQSQRVYLKNMLLTPGAEGLLPDWAFFAQAVVNARKLRPTASRESICDDEILEQTRDELGMCLRQYLIRMARENPQQLQRFISTHHLAIKALAIDDDECLKLFADWLPFETSLGTMSLGEFRAENPTLRFVSTRDQFRQIAHVAASQSLAVINAGYVFDIEILERIGEVFDDLQVTRFEVDELSDEFEELTLEERDATLEFERLADLVLQKFKCAAELSRFRPVELPALYMANQEVQFLRSLQQAQETADSIWDEVLLGLAGESPSQLAHLQLNFSNPLIQRIANLGDRTLQASCVEMLYVQSLLLGHVPLKKQEVQLLNDGLLKLISSAIDLK